MVLAQYKFVNFICQVRSQNTIWVKMNTSILIHEDDPQSRPVVITIFTRVSVLPSVSTFQNHTNLNNFQAKIVIATDGNVGLAEWIIDDTCVLYR